MGKPASPRKRLDPAVFNLPVERMASGYYSDKYFVRTREVLHADGHSPHVVVQVFGRSAAFLGGMDEAIAILKLCSDNFEDLQVHALHDGDEVDVAVEEEPRRIEIVVELELP